MGLILHSSWFYCLLNQKKKKKENKYTEYTFEEY